MTPEIIPLEMPANWHVDHNNFFYDVDIKEGKNGYVANDIDLGFHTGLMHMQHFATNDKVKRIEMKAYAIDLGWYPEGRIDGEYVLVVLHTNWENVKLEYASKDRYTIQKALNFCLAYINHHQKLPSNFDKIFARAMAKPQLSQVDSLPRLMPLRMYSLVAVAYNGFYDQPLERSSAIRSGHQLLLKLKRSEIKNQPTFGWFFSGDELTLKWLYSDDEGYSYFLQFWNNGEMMLEYKHSDRFVMQKLINFCMKTVCVTGYGYDFEEQALQAIRSDIV